MKYKLWNAYIICCASCWALAENTYLLLVSEWKLERTGTDDDTNGDDLHDDDGSGS